MNSTNEVPFQGSYVAMMTPFRNNEVDEDALRKMVNFQIENGAQGLVPMGTTGEASTASHEEHQRVIRIVVDEVSNRIPVLAGAGSNNPTEALALAKYAEEVGASGALCVAGYYNRPSQEGLYQHFKTVHDNTSLPIIIYNIPPRAIVDITPTTMARLAELPRIIGVKDATSDLSRPTHERQLITKPFRYLSGDDQTAVAYNAMGGNGCISVVANVAPALCARMQNFCAEGDFISALEIQEKLLPLNQVLVAEPSPAGVKYAASLLGLCSEEVRSPIVTLGEDSKISIQMAMKDLELI